jgi:hypothetical protein
MSAKRFSLLFATLCTLVLGSVQSFAEQPGGELTPSERHAYHACLYGTFIHSYCHFNLWGSYSAAYNECVVSNRARPVVGFQYWDVGVEDECRNFILSRRRH